MRLTSWKGGVKSAPGGAVKEGNEDVAGMKLNAEEWKNANDSTKVINRFNILGDP